MAKTRGSSKIRSVGLACVLAVTCAGGGYFVGKNNSAIVEKIAALAPAKKTGKIPLPPIRSAPDTPLEFGQLEAHAKSAEKVELTRMIKTGVEPNPVAAPAPEDIEPPPLSISLFKKDVFQVAAEGDDHPNKLTLSVAFENQAGKPIRAFEGVLKFTDGADKKIYSSRISVSALISEGATLKWDEQLDATKLDDKSRRHLSEEQENLKAAFQVKKIFFVDGTVKKYGTRG